MSLLVEAGALLIAAVTKWIQASGEQITPKQLVAKAEKYAEINLSELESDRADDLRHFEHGTPGPVPGDEPD
jgi:hypothetical protein